jgi:hypothetical protein
VTHQGADDLMQRVSDELERIDEERAQAEALAALEREAPPPED